MSGAGVAHLGTVKEDSDDLNPRTDCDPGHMRAVWVHLHRQAPQQALLLREVPPGMEKRPPGHLPRVRSALHPQPLNPGVLHASVQRASGQARTLRARPRARTHLHPGRGRGRALSDLPGVRGRVHPYALNPGVLLAGVQARARQCCTHARSTHDRGCARVRAHQAPARARLRRGVRGVRAPLAVRDQAPDRGGHGR